MLELTTAVTGNVLVHTTQNRGATIEELAERALDKIVYVGDSAPEPIRLQALAYRERIGAVILTYMKEAVRADRETLKAQLAAQGHDTSFLGE